MKTCTQCGKEYPDTVKFCPVDGTTLRSKSPNADLVGQVVADRYHIIRKLGEGGMGAVYLGEHVKMGRKSAIKVMAPAMANDPDAISRFNREAANASQISHANVCQIFDFGETPEGIIYLAMEFIEGQALTDVIDEAGALDPVRAARILRQSADGLAAAHDLGIVHRDLKPDNIMIVKGRDGLDIAKVVDFGIAKAVQGDDTSQKVTKTGLVVGTPEYMSPEQLAGDKLDGRSDIYSLGLVLYRMLTGVLPFQADSAQETMIKRLTDDPMPLLEARPDIVFPARLQAVLDRALARDAAQRYANASDFGRECVEAVEGMAVPETRVGAAPLAASAATQVMDTESALKLSTKYQQAARGGAGGGAVAPVPVPARKSALLPVLGGSGAVAVLALVGWFAMGRPGMSNAAADSTAQIAATAAAPESTSAPTTRPNPNPGTSRTPVSRPGTTNPPPADPRESATTTTPPVTPPAAAITAGMLQDSLRVAEQAGLNENFGRARSLATWIYQRPESSGRIKGEAARAMADAYMGENNAPEAISWLRRVLQHIPGDAGATRALSNLGATP